MPNDDLDDDIRRHFEALRREDARAAPPFARVVAGKPRRISRLGIAAPLAVAATVLVIAVFVQSRDAPLPAGRAVVADPLALDFLLQTSTAYSDVPDFDSDPVLQRRLR